VLLALVVLTGFLHPLVATVVCAGLAVASRRYRKVLVVITVVYALIAVFLTAYSFSNPTSIEFGS
jgi:hypothetical protein